MTPLLLSLIYASAILFAAVGVGFTAKLALDRFLAHAARVERESLWTLAAQKGRITLIILLSLAAVAVGLRVVSLEPDLTARLQQAIVVLAGVTLTFFLGRSLAAFVTLYGRANEAIRPLAPMTRRLGQILLWIVALLMLLQYLDVSITPLITAMGVAGLAVAIALQDTLANFFSGLYLLADRPVRAGDYVKLEGGEEGYVVNVGWRSTRIRTLPNNIVVIPNQKLAQSVITNYHLPEERTALLVNIGVSYDCDPQHVEDVLTQVATGAAGEVQGLLPEPAPFVRFIPGFGAYSLDFTLICQVREFVDNYYVQHELRKRIYRRFKEEGINIPFPIQTVLLEGNTVPSSRDQLDSGMNTKPAKK